ncbi:PIN domain-containing protein [Petralouisia muris]|uniref:PIN domain-containing protein n=1 Tax=Petralouisia muris TaxID=3032872 RepID=A0AC61RTM5_9FIRM|nr:PIN domain-containing protein [Petralouisia muris]TGY94996.1 PIN domain-containing protein [Petralouisia muris]
MTDFKKVFLDTSPVVYYLECNELYYLNMKKFWKEYGECDYVTSAVTVTEYLTFPYQQNNLQLINAFYAFINGMDIEIKSIDKTIADKAAQIRAEYKGFKAMDALQLATACLTGCDLFLTNDKQLRQFREIKCITVDELE